MSVSVGRLTLKARSAQRASLEGIESHDAVLPLDVQSDLVIQSQCQPVITDYYMYRARSRQLISSISSDMQEKILKQASKSVEDKIQFFFKLISSPHRPSRVRQIEPNLSLPAFLGDAPARGQLGLPPGIPREGNIAGLDVVAGWERRE